ncbi:hypothetical protein CRUP_034642 [Coryphaenoides rupestris]|nr:hypothetical protein CRUP_034642 [Coryphaenoides rupestris]
MKHLRYRLPVHRSYNDFDVFRALLLQRFPYRMVAQLPPKRMLKGVLSSQSERDFIECRRRGLERFVALVVQHPFMGEDTMVDVFLCASAEDVQQKLRDSFKSLGDEFMTNWIASKAKDYLPADIKDQVASCREFIGPNQDHVQRVWRIQRRSLRRMSQEFTTLASKAEEKKQGSLKETDELDKLNAFVDLLHAYKELCDRHEHSMLIEHRKALNSTSNLRLGATTNSLANDILRAQQFGSNLAKQENAIITMELRNDFSLLCLHQETQIFLRHLPLATQILASFIQSQAQAHTETAGPSSHEPH